MKENEFKIILEDINEKYHTMIEGQHLFNEKLDRHIPPLLVSVPRLTLVPDQYVQPKAGLGAGGFLLPYLQCASRVMK